jgi:hypothetical protein
LTVPPSPGQSRVQEAARLLQAALSELRKEEREREERRRAWKPRAFSDREQEAIRKAELRAIKEQHLIKLNRTWFWSFANGMIDTLQQVAADAKKRGATADARTIGRVIDEVCGQLEKIQAKEVAK